MTRMRLLLAYGLVFSAQRVLPKTEWSHERLGWVLDSLSMALGWGNKIPGGPAQ